METKKINPTLLIVGALVAIALAIGLIVRQATLPHETINDLSKIPPKGAGKAELHAAEKRAAGGAQQPAGDRM